MKTKLIAVALAFALFQLPSVAVETANKPPSIQGIHSGDLHDLIEDFREKNVEFIEARRELRRQLAETNDPEERRALIRAFIREYSDEILAQRNLRKSFRHEHMELRRERRGDPPRGQN